MSRHLPRPCLDCKRPTRNGSRCSSCHAEHRQIYGPAWRKVSRAIRAAPPRCSRCGSTRDLTGDHVKARSLDAGVQVLCRRCNASKGDR